VLVEPVQSRHPETRPVESPQGDSPRSPRHPKPRSSSMRSLPDFVFTRAAARRCLEFALISRPTERSSPAGMPDRCPRGQDRFMDALDGGMWQYGDDSTLKWG